AGDRTQAADLLDPQARAVGHRDLGLVEQHPAVHRVELAQRGSVEVDLGDHVGLGHGQVHGRAHADAGLQHATDHAVDAVHAADVGDAHGVGNAAGLHQLDVDDVRRAHPDQLDDLHRAEHALVGHHRSMHALGDVAQPLQVVRLDRLLDQLKLDPGVLQRLQRVYRLLGAPALVGVQAEQGTALDRGMDRLGPLDVHADVLADLDLQRLEAAFHRCDRVGDQLVDVVDADGDVGGDHRVAAAQQLVQRRPVKLAPQVVHRDLDGGLGAG